MTTEMLTTESAPEVSEVLSALAEVVSTETIEVTPASEPAPAKKTRKKSAPRRKRAAKTAATPAPVSFAFGGAYSGATESDELTILEQIELFRKSPVSAVLGAIMGGSVPVATFVTKHYDMGLNEYLMWVMVVCGLVYSALTVYNWAKVPFGGVKALGFVGIVELTMTMSNIPALAFAMLAMLVGINAIAGGANIARKSIR